MKHRPSFSNEIDEDKIFEVINKNFSKIAPYWFKLMSNWLIRAYNDFGDIDKFIILIYFINKDLIFCRKNGLIIDYETFYNDKSIEIPKINISDISRDLIIPKESVRRKIQDLEKEGVIRKSGKKIFVDSSAFIKAKAKAEKTLKEVSTLLNKFNKILKDEKITNKVFTIDQITVLLKNNFSFCWYQFHRLLFVFTNRWRITVDDLETLTLFLVVLLNTVDNKSFKAKVLNRENWTKIAQGADDVGVNPNSLSDITGIPRPTVTRKIKRLIEDGFLHINKKKLIIMKMTSSRFKKQIKMQDQNMKSLSNMLHRIFNQIKNINTS
jgi:DNA-binding Lrp family transcriptional regulator